MSASQRSTRSNSSASVRSEANSHVETNGSQRSNGTPSKTAPSRIESVTSPASTISTRSSRKRGAPPGTPSRSELSSDPRSPRTPKSASKNGGETPQQPGTPGSLDYSLIDSRAPSVLESITSPLSYATSVRSAVGSVRSNAGGSYRADLSSSVRSHRQVTVPESSQEQVNIPSADGSGTKIVVWGTDICIGTVQTTFKQFLKRFRVATVADDELALQDGMSNTEVDLSRPYYMQKLNEIALIEQPFLNLNLQHIRDYNQRLYLQIITYPAEIIPYLDLAATEVFFAEHGASALGEQIQIRPFNAEKTRNMRGLDPEDIDKLITVSGMVVRTSALIPEMKIGFFECSVCKNTTTVEVERGRIEEPTLCQHCNTGHSFVLVHNRSVFLDKQMVKLQESPDDMPPGQTPHTVALYAYGELVDIVQPGDRVNVTGIYRAMPLRVNPRTTVCRSVYKSYVDVVHFRKSDAHKLHLERDGSHMSAERIEELKLLALKSDVYERLAHALAPSIYEHEDIKKGILCQLFGGTSKDATNAGRGKFRAEINVLLCGDPGTSKSQLLQYVHTMVPRSQYTSGKGSSAVGLTAYVTKDPDTRQLVLQTGALVLSDNGICCIDEFDKMNDSTRSVLHEVMEQQTLSIAKAGIICQLNARASILAAANPVDSQWNRNKTIIENVQLPPTLLSRFDLIFLMVDPQDEYYDRRLATHLVGLYYKTAEQETGDFLDMAVLRDYIGYAKANINPKITDEASSCLIEKYVTMRKIGSGRGQVSAFPRQLESLIRIAEAHAKIRLSEKVEVKDVEEAYRLHREALKQSAIDPVTGKVDVNILALGVSASSRKQIAELMEVIKQRLAGRHLSVAYRDLLKEMREGSDKMITREIFDDALNELRKSDLISRDSNNRIKLLPRMAFDE